MHQVQRALFLDVVIRERASIFQLFASKDQALLIRRDSFLVLNLGLHVVNGIASLDVKSDGLAGESLDKDLHATTKAEHQVQRALFLDVVIRERASIFQLFAGKDQALLIRRDSFLVLNLG